MPAYVDTSEYANKATLRRGMTLDTRHSTLGTRHRKMNRPGREFSPTNSPGIGDSTEICCDLRQQYDLTARWISSAQTKCGCSQEVNTLPACLPPVLTGIPSGALYQEWNNLTLVSSEDLSTSDTRPTQRIFSSRQEESLLSKSTKNTYVQVVILRSKLHGLPWRTEQ